MKIVVKDLMTSSVKTVGPEAGFKDMVHLIESSGISALPVVDGQRRVLGVVSEADLLLKEERADLQDRHLIESRGHRMARTKAEARTAQELMTSSAVTATEDLSLREAARLMHEKAVKRLPVVDDQGRLVGIISRADMLKVFMRSDEELRREVIDEVIVKDLWMDPSNIQVEVSDGMVQLSGEVDRRTDVTILSTVAAAVYGVVGVDAGRLKYQLDDTRTRRLSQPR